MNLKLRDKTNAFLFEEVNGPIIHGRTKIELRNVKTGLIERYEKENTFQQGVLANYQRQYGCFDASPYWSDASHKPNTIWQNMVGGLFLFRDQIPVNTRYMPAGNQMIGCGAIGIVNNDAPTEMGSYNSSESSASATAITQVYDYTTSQANGNINCVCLTSNAGGMIGYGNRSGGRYVWAGMNAGQKNGSQSQANRNYAMEAWSKNHQHNFSLDANGILTVTRTNRPITAGSVFEGWTKTQTYDLSESIPAAQRGLGMPEVVADGIIRMFVGINTAVAAGDDALYLEYNSTNQTVQVKTLANPSSKTVYVGYQNTSKFFLGDYAIMTADYSEEIIDASTGLLAYEFNTNHAHYALNYSDTFWDYFPDAIGAGLFVLEKEHGNISSFPYIVDVIAQTESYLNIAPKAGGAMTYSVCTQHGELDIMRGIFNYNRGIVIKNPLYLATINNIQTVPKSANQTMKVIYTLTEA